MLRTVVATRYVTPLREGGSVPALVEGDDGDLYVVKFRGAGQGPKPLLAEILGGEIARHLGLNVPELVYIELDPLLARNEPNPEIRDPINASAGLNLGMRFLSGAFAYNPLLKPPVDPTLAAQVVWFDSFILNVDRTARNVNLLHVQQQIWLIDHGAAFYFHFDWSSAEGKISSPFALVKQHVLLPFSAALPAVDADARTRLDDATLSQIVTLLPSAWLTGEKHFVDDQAQRAAYLRFLIERREQSAVFVEEAERARSQLA